MATHIHAQIVVVLRGSLHVDYCGGAADIAAGEVVLMRPGECVRYNTPELAGTLCSNNARSQPGDRAQHTNGATQMRHLPTSILAATVFCACASPRATTNQDIILSGDASIAWGPAPAVFPVGAQLAVLEGDPSKAQEFTVRLRMPAGYRIPPHTHPTDENVTVVSGSFKVGMGTTFDTSKMKQLGLGGFVTAPANMAHYAEAVGETVVQVHAMGPFTLTYVNVGNALNAANR